MVTVLGAPPPLGARGRALGAFYGLAVGDALGMPTQDLTRAQVAADHPVVGGRLTGFEAPGPSQRIAAGLPAGSVTDDTEQAVLLAELLVEGRGAVDPHRFAELLLGWEAAVAARGSLDLLGPSTRRAVDLLRAGTPVELSGAGGTTNGAAMRVTPVGLATATDPLDALVDAVVAVSRVTHATPVALSAAAAVAAAVSAGVEGGGRPAALAFAAEAADLGAVRGGGEAADGIGPAVRRAVDRVAGVPAEELGAVLDAEVGTSLAADESVVAALALVAALADPWEVVTTAAAAGGDTDTTAAIAGAVAGAAAGLGGLPADAVATVREVNDLHLEPLVDALLALRDRS